MIEARPGGALLDDCGLRQVTGTVALGLALDLKPGQTVFPNSNQEGACEIHGLLLGDQLAQPEQYKQDIRASRISWLRCPRPRHPEFPGRYHG